MWSHNLPGEPNWILSELDKDGYEVRKVQIYRDGRCEWTDAQHETSNIGLSEVPFPDVSEISGQPEFDAVGISCQYFENVWACAQDKRRP
ncbi:DUF6881 domain-containing protein [Saccharomonospora piscinae]|uniref:DUF6881 domain-containing protein n=1 Tax=Saccharomonospora piscinae TaxID=687388 RepID=UPI0031343DCD